MLGGPEKGMPKEIFKKTSPPKIHGIQNSANSCLKGTLGGVHFKPLFLSEGPSHWSLEHVCRNPPIIVFRQSHGSTVLFVLLTPLGDLFHIKHDAAGASKRALALEFCFLFDSCSVFLFGFVLWFFFSMLGIKPGASHIRQMF